MLRPILLSLSQQKQLRNWMERSPVSRPLTRRFIAGPTLGDEIRVVKAAAADGYLSSLDFLGENISSEHEADLCRDHYMAALESIRREHLPASVSIKLTQFGLDLSNQLCLVNVRALVACARDIGTRVEIDMESSEYTDRTLKIVHAMHAEFPGCVRAVIQAYLYRSETDIQSLSESGIPVRLCKGAYKEPPVAAVQEKAAVDANYRKLMFLLLSKGAYPAIASHDEKIVREAVAYARSNGIEADKFEFQMLYGIRRDLQRELIQQGFRLRLYIPYGDAWYPYFMRRLAERPANLLFLLRNLVRR